MRQRIDVDLDELDQIIDRSTHAPQQAPRKRPGSMNVSAKYTGCSYVRSQLSESEGQKLKTALHALAEGLARKTWTSRVPASRLARDMDVIWRRTFWER